MVISALCQYGEDKSRYFGIKWYFCRFTGSLLTLVKVIIN